MAENGVNQHDDDDGDSVVSTESITDQQGKKSITVVTYSELHQHVQAIVEILEEVYEIGILKGRGEEFEMSAAVRALLESEDSN